MRLLLFPVFRAMEVPTDYKIGTLILSVFTSTIYEEVDHAVQVIAEEARRQLMSMS